MKSRILYLSRNYPNNIFGTNGLWVEGLVREMASFHDVRVIAPVPYSPPFLPPTSSYARYRKILTHENINGVDIYRPRFISPPGYWLHGYLGDMIYQCIVNKIDKYREKFPFDLIHAQFSYPDGYIGARLAKRYNIPLVITEHASWIPWMVDYPRARKKAVWATQVSSAVIAGSHYLSKTISGFIDEPEKLNLIPIGVNRQLFKPEESSTRRRSDRIIYVGRIHVTKGVDILFRAMSLLIKRNADIKLTLVGGDLGFKNFQLQEEKMRSLATELGINSNLEFAGTQPPEKVVEYVQQSALLVLPSRRESFGAVLTEALACGIPVVATRCGGPEDFIKEGVGILVDKENPEALADGIEHVISNLDRYVSAELSQYAHDGYSWESVAERTNILYEKALSDQTG